MAAHSAERKQVMRLLAKMRKVVAGLQAHGDLVPILDFLGQTATPAQVLARLQPSLAAATLVDTIKASLKGALARRDAALTADESYLQGVSSCLYSTLGSSNVQLSFFGVPYDKPRKKRTQAEEAVSTALRLQTRKVRGTMGAKQRAAITVAGTPGVVVVDPTGKPIPGGGRAPIPPAPVPPAKKPGK